MEENEVKGGKNGMGLELITLTLPRTQSYHTLTSVSRELRSLSFFFYLLGM